MEKQLTSIAAVTSFATLVMFGGLGILKEQDCVKYQAVDCDETGCYYVVKQDCSASNLSAEKIATDAPKGTTSTPISAWIGKRDLVDSESARLAVGEAPPEGDATEWPCACAPRGAKDCEWLIDNDGKWGPAPSGVTLQTEQWRGDGCVRKPCVEIANGNPGHTMPERCK